VPAVELFARSATQWRHAGMGGAPVGLDYAGVRQVAELTGVELTQELFGEIQTLEASAVREFARRASERNRR
jgi:hypothetical protein